MKATGLKLSVKTVAPNMWKLRPGLTPAFRLQSSVSMTTCPPDVQLFGFGIAHLPVTQWAKSGSQTTRWSSTTLRPTGCQSDSQAGSSASPRLVALADGTHQLHHHRTDRRPGRSPPGRSGHPDPCYGDDDLGVPCRPGAGWRPRYRRRCRVVARRSCRSGRPDSRSARSHVK